MLRHQGLHKEHTAFRVQPRRQPIERHVHRIFPNVRGVGVVSRQGVPVGDKKVAVVLMLQAHPVVEGSHVVAEMQFAGGPHAAQHAFKLRRVLNHWLDCTEKTSQMESSKTRKKPSTGLVIAMVTPPPKNSMRN